MMMEGMRGLREEQAEQGFHEGRVGPPSRVCQSEAGISCLALLALRTKSKERMNFAIACCIFTARRVYL